MPSTQSLRAALPERSEHWWKAPSLTRLAPCKLPGWGEQQMRARSGLQPFSERPDWSVEKIWGLWPPLKWDIKLPDRRPLAPVQREPPNQAALWVGCGSSLCWFLSLLSTYCPSHDSFTMALPGEGRSPPTCLLHLTWVLIRGHHKNHPQGSSELGLGFCQFSACCGFQSKHWAACAEMKRLPGEFQIPLCISTSSSRVSTAVVEQCFRAEGTVPTHPSPGLQKFTKNKVWS